MGYIEKGRAKTITKVILWAVVISFIATIFIQWGAQRAGIFGGGAAFSINGNSIDGDELRINVAFYDYLTNRLVTPDNYQELIVWNGAVNQIGGALAGSIYQTVNTEDRNVVRYLQAIQMMIGDIVLSQEARTAGIRVSDKEVANTLGRVYRDPNGKFLGQEYVERDLARYNIGTDSQPRFRRLLKRHLLARYYVNSLFASVQPELEQHVREVYEAQSRNVTFDYVVFDPLSLVGELEYNSDDLATYLNEHSSEFLIADMVMFDTALYKDSLQISDEEIRLYYDENKDDEFTEEEQRDVRRILIRVAADADDEALQAAETKIEQVYADLSRPGEEFGTVARKYSEDESARSEEGMITGVTREGARDQAFIDTVFALEEEGDYNTEAARTQDGFEVIQLVSTRSGRILELEEVREEIRETIAEERAEEEAPIEADKLRSRAVKEDLATLAEPLYVTVQRNLIAIEGEGEIFAMGTVLSPLGSPSDTNALFNTDEGGLTNVMEIFENQAFFRIVSKGESLVSRFEDIRLAVVRRYTIVESRELAAQRSQDFFKQVESATNLEDFTTVVEERNLAAEQVSTNKYQGTFRFGADILSGALNAGENTVTGPFERDNKHYILFVSAVDEFDNEDFAEQKEQIKNQLINQWMQGQMDLLTALNIVESNFSEMLEAQISFLVLKSDIRLNRDVLRQMFGTPEA
jgi:hypothetical protein